MKKKMSNRTKTYLLILVPALILFILFNTWPMINGLIYSFTNYKGYGKFDWVGLRNYTDLFQDGRVLKSCCLPLNMRSAERFLSIFFPC